MMAYRHYPSEEETQQTLRDHLALLSHEQEERLARYRASAAQLSYINLTAYPLNIDDLQLLDKEDAEKAGAVIFYRHGQDLRLGIVRPDSAEAKKVIDQLKKQLGITPRIYVISPRSLQSALSQYPAKRSAGTTPQDEMRISKDLLKGFKKSLAGFEELGARINSLPPTEVLSEIMAGSIKMKASDIHIEPKEKEARLRYRIDGILYDFAVFGREGWHLLLSRVKVLTKLKLNVRDRPQDGSFVLRVDSEVYDIRVSTLPGEYGENVVMRILSRKAEVAQVGELGMKERDFALVQTALKRENGMILVTGPTGSGKTTTLASFVKEINTPESKIITLEDPIEYRIAGVEQTQVDPSAGYTFSTGLRSILRQDPDVILVGEMRDTETAETAVHAALTGHLVFTTLHTNDAAGAVPRLIDMGIKPFVLAPALSLVIAQRLVRLPCKNCSQEYHPSPVLRERIRGAMQGVRPEIFDPKSLDDPKLMFVKAVGCRVCTQTGYRGRLGVFEIFTMNDEIRELVLAKASGAKFLAAALRQGMTTVAQDGFLKVMNKITTVEEVERVSEE